MPGIRFFSSMGHFGSRLDRLLAQGRFLKCLLQVRPKILVCCTYELLPVASFLKPLLGYKLVYDVQENYRANLGLNPALSAQAREKADRLIQRAEAAKGIDLFLLAEKCYAEEMPEKRPFLILENKFQGEINRIAPVSHQGGKKFRFCISGTITPAFGTWDAICWFGEILKYYPESELEIIGHCPIEAFWVKLTQVAKEIPQLILHVDRGPVAHESLIAALAKADFALLPYQIHPAVSAKMPTKLFECAALGIPVLITPNPVWEDFLVEFTGGHPIDFSVPSDAPEQFGAALGQTFFSSAPPASILWKTEKHQLQQAFQKLLS